VEEADGPVRLTPEETWGPTWGSVRIEFVFDRASLKAIKSSWQISGKRRSKALGPATGRVLDPT